LTEKAIAFKAKMERAKELEEELIENARKKEEQILEQARRKADEIVVR
jgi:vacuolar-type H+-ATPase subunit H